MTTGTYTNNYQCVMQKMVDYDHQIRNKTRIVYNSTSVVPATDEKNELVAITITRQRDSICGTYIVAKNTFLKN